MRHGDVAYFDENGQRVADSRLVVLTPQGRAEALAMRDVLAGVPFDKAICSGLPRTVETGAIILGGRTVPLEINSSLEEIRGGTPEQRAAMQPAEYAYAMFAAKSNDPGAAYARGERLSAFYDRVVAAWTDVLRQPGWTTLLIAAHGGVNRAILSHATGSGPAAFGAFEQDTGCLNVIDADLGTGGQVLRQIVRAMNVTPSDPAKLGRKFTAMELLALKAFPHMKPAV